MPALSEQIDYDNNLRGQIPETRQALAQLPFTNTAIEPQVGTVFPALPTNMKCWSGCGDNTNKSDRLQHSHEWETIATILPQPSCQGTNISEDSRRLQILLNRPSFGQTTRNRIGHPEEPP